MIHSKTIFRIIGSLLLLLAGVFFLFSVVSPFLEGNALFGFLVSTLSTTLVGLWCCIIGKGSKGEFSRRDSYITITACWVAFAFFGSLPYWLGGHIPSHARHEHEERHHQVPRGEALPINMCEAPHHAVEPRSIYGTIQSVHHRLQSHKAKEVEAAQHIQRLQALSLHHIHSFWNIHGHLLLFYRKDRNKRARNIKLA